MLIISGHDFTGQLTQHELNSKFTVQYSADTWIERVGAFPVTPQPKDIAHDASQVPEFYNNTQINTSNISKHSWLLLNLYCCFTKPPFSAYYSAVLLFLMLLVFDKNILHKITGLFISSLLCVKKTEPHIVQFFTSPLI